MLRQSRIRRISSTVEAIMLGSSVFDSLANSVQTARLRRSSFNRNEREREREREREERFIFGNIRDKLL